MAVKINLKNDRTESVQLQMIGGRCWLVCSSTARPLRNLQVDRNEARQLAELLTRYADTGVVD